MNLTKRNCSIKLHPSVDVWGTHYRASIMIRENAKPFFFVDTSSLSYAQIMAILGSLIEDLFDKETQEFWENHIKLEFEEFRRKKEMQLET